MVPMWLVELMASWIEEDTGMGDITTQCLISDSQVARANIIVKEDAVIAGIEETTALLRFIGLEASPMAEDGHGIRANTIIMEVEGSAHTMLAAERTVLNIISRMSGIATATARALEKARAINPDVRIAATRKTTPGFGYLEKRAVIAGGGDSHRWCLDDMVLIKDNHLAIFCSDGKSASDAIKVARSKVSFSKKIEIEVQDTKTAVECAMAGADIIMLDNFTPSAAAEAYRKIKETNPSVIVEVSGGITLDNIEQYAAHADVISMGALTHSVKAIDVSMEIVSPR